MLFICMQWKFRVALYCLFVCLLLYDGRQYQALPKSDYPYNFSERNTPELTVLWGKVNKGGVIDFQPKQYNTSPCELVAIISYVMFMVCIKRAGLCPMAPLRT